MNGRPKNDLVNYCGSYDDIWQEVTRCKCNLLRILFQTKSILFIRTDKNDGIIDRRLLGKVRNHDETTNLFYKQYKETLEEIYGA